MLAENACHCFIITSILKACFALTLRLCGCEQKTKTKSTAVLKVYFISESTIFAGLIEITPKVRAAIWAASGFAVAVWTKILPSSLVILRSRPALRRSKAIDHVLTEVAFSDRFIFFILEPVEAYFCIGPGFL
jgi:hypothetical protein